MLPTPDEQARVVIELLAVLRREQKNKIRLRYRGTDADKYARLEKCRKLERQFDALLKSIDPNTPTRYDEILSVALTMREWQIDTIKKKTRFNVRTTRAYASNDRCFDLFYFTTQLGLGQTLSHHSFLH